MPRVITDGLPYPAGLQVLLGQQFPMNKKALLHKASSAGLS
jgi:hypothetical protein